MAEGRDHLLDARLDMSLDDIVKDSYTSSRPQRRFASTRRPVAARKPYDRVRPSRPPPSQVKLSSVTNRLYVGNLSYGVSWQDLKDHMRAAGNVVFAEVLADPTGRSKGCGIVEYATRSDAIRAIKTLNESELDGRLIFLREDREDRNRPPSPPPQRTSYRISVPEDTTDTPGCQVFVHNLPYSTSWQDLKDIFRTVGTVVRADILYGQDGRPKGSGVVLFASPADAARAIWHLDEREFDGRLIYVEKDKFEGER